jgi:hypothetical protein
MPFFRTAGKTCYFSHIPKTGGTSVEDYLIERFGPLAMLDRRFNFLPPAERWCQTSPQHIEWKSLQMFLPLELIDAVFTVVRHPIARTESGYRFQIQVEKSISPETSFSDWLHGQVRMMKANPFALDNHMRPQVDFVPEGAAVFHLEFGLDPLVPYFDDLAGNTDGHRTIGHSNKSKTPRNTEIPAWAKPSQADIDFLYELYREDFERFGYRPEQKKPVIAKPALPQSFVEARERELAHRSSFSYRWNRRLKRWRARFL